MKKKGRRRGQTHLNVDPEEAVADLLLEGELVEVVDLLCGVPARRAGEDVDVDVLEAGPPGEVDALRADRVDGPDAPVAPDDGKRRVLLLAEALPRLDVGVVVRHVDALDHLPRGRGAEEKKENGKELHSS